MGNRTALIVDDEESIIDILSKVAGKLDLNAIGASNGEAAMQIAEERTPDLIITDISMPKMDGIKLLTELRERNYIRPVILVTGYPDLDMSVRALRMGAFDLLTKPFKLDLVLSTVRAALEYVWQQDAAMEQLQSKGLLDRAPPEVRKHLVQLMANRRKKPA